MTFRQGRNSFLVFVFLCYGRTHRLAGDAADLHNVTPGANPCV